MPMFVALICEDAGAIDGKHWFGHSAGATGGYFLPEFLGMTAMRPSAHQAP